MQTRRLALLSVLPLTAAMLYGCGGGGGGSEIGTPANPPVGVVGTASCKVCHTAVVAEGWNGSAHDISSVGCEDCHGGGQAHRGIGPIPIPSPGLAQCSTCHEAVMATHGGDDPSTPDAIEGYALDNPQGQGCFGCHSGQSSSTVNWAHNPSSLAINQQWARSAHGGLIGTIKAEDAAAAVTKDLAPGWVYYNWDHSTGEGNRAACQRCHTATGARNFLNSPGTYNSANNNFSHLEGWTAATGSPQNELLYCWSCHSNVRTGTVRNPGSLTIEYTNSVTTTYPDAGPSNVCMACHTGRASGDSIAGDASETGVRSFISSHYLPAGGTVFNETGYHFAGETYDTYGFHKNVGVGDLLGTGTAGPCVTCHMSGPEPHTFVASTQSASCTNCHGTLTEDLLGEKKQELSQSLEELKVALAASGIHFYEAFPYFFTAPYVAGGTNTGFTNWAGVHGLAAWKDAMGAAFNYNLLKHDPGAFAHNKQYALKLIADSIDFLDDGLVNDSTADSLAATLLVAAAPMSTEGYALVHDEVAVASEVNCGACHNASPHYGAVQFTKAQYLTTNVSCASCHAGDNLDVLDEYAGSGHGDVTATAWARNNNSGTCQACHTTQGFINTWTGSGDAVQLSGVLACSACHSDVAAGELRHQFGNSRTVSYNPGPVTYTYNNLGRSSVCLHCHYGRSAGNPNVTGAGNPVTPHYAATAGTVFAPTIGYHYAGRPYAAGPHASVGVSSGAGPCVACHMSGGNAGHSFSALENPICDTCHPGSAASSGIAANKAALAAADLVLKKMLASKGIYYIPNHPYYTSDPEGTPPPAFNAWGTVPKTVGLGFLNAAGVQGAVFNFHFIHYEKGAHVHNLTYALQLLRDSISFLYDGDPATEVIEDAIDYLVTEEKITAAEGNAAKAAFALL